MNRLLKLTPGVYRNSTVIAKKASGSWLVDINDKKYLDMTSGIGALSTGHCHPKVVSNVKTQVETLVHAQQNCIESHLPLMELTSKFQKHLPSKLDTFYFTNSGSEAVENAIKLSRKATNKTNIISFMGGFHGRTLGCMSLSTSKTSCREGYQPLMPGIFHLNFPYEGKADQICNDLDNMLARATNPNETAAILLEPILGEGGVYKADTDFVKYVREICDKHNIMWISDEVQTGVGRTGKWWGYEHFGVDPDIITFGKGIASGFPFAGIVSNYSNYEKIQDNGLGGTYNGNVIACSAANATIDILNSENLIEESEGKGVLIANKITALNHPLVNEVRQYGLMIAIELNVDTDKFRKIMQDAENHNLLLLTTGIHSTIRLLPPLNISVDEIDYFIDKLAILLNSHK